MDEGLEVRNIRVCKEVSLCHERDGTVHIKPGMFLFTRMKEGFGNCLWFERKRTHVLVDQLYRVEIHILWRCICDV